MGLRGAIVGSFGFLAALCAGPAGAGNVPLGSYLWSCRDAALDGSTLTATCSAAGGYWVPARLENYPFCVGDIANQNGTLFCMRASSVLGIETPAARAARGMPPAGSYMGTCRNIRLDDGWLKATCADHAGRWVETAIAANWCGVLGKDIANMDGQFSCR
ncbi:CVNH domain-containing protein [Xanthobacter sediminis]